MSVCWKLCTSSISPRADTSVPKGPQSPTLATPERESHPLPCSLQGSLSVIRHAPASGPLHLHLLCLEPSFTKRFLGPLSPLLDLDLDVTFLVRSSLRAPFNIAPPNPILGHQPLFCFGFLHRTHYPQMSRLFHLLIYFSLSAPPPTHTHRDTQ